jgi:16S rRNA (guanine966-N2)-methyltransferase
MRITGGVGKGRRLANIKGAHIRPTSDMVRASIFNILGQRLTELAALDLFAGTGSLGIESLSRGARKAVFIDKSTRAVAIIKKNLSICGYEALSVIRRDELPNGLACIQGVWYGQFDLVFIDPPYGKGYIEPTIHKLIELKLLAKDSRVVVESARSQENPFPAQVHDLQLRLSRSYGSTLIGFYSYHEER